MIHQAPLTYSCSLRNYGTIVQLFYDCRKSTAPEMGRKLGKNDCGWKSSAITLIGNYLSGKPDLNSKWYSAHIRKWILPTRWTITKWWVVFCGIRGHRKQQDKKSLLKRRFSTYGLSQLVTWVVIKMQSSGPTQWSISLFGAHYKPTSFFDGTHVFEWLARNRRSMRLEVSGQQYWRSDNAPKPSPTRCSLHCGGSAK